MIKVGIVGGGSVGLLLGAYLTKSGHDVTIYTNSKEQSRLIHKQGLTLYKSSKKYNFSVKSQPFKDVTKLDEDIVFIAVKQYHIEEVVSKILKLNGQLSSIVFVQNGMAHMKYLETLLIKVDQISVAVIEHGAYKKSATEVSHTGEGEMKVGSYYCKENTQIKLLWEQLSNEGFLTKSYYDWAKLLVDKLIINSVVNPLTAIYRVENGALLKNKYFFKMMRVVFDELSNVFDCTEDNWKQIIQVCEKTSSNRSSMLKDIEEGRRTEIDAITGYVLEKATQKNIPLLYNEFVYFSVKGLEKGGLRDE